jgi:hypothetical protein
MEELLVQDLPRLIVEPHRHPLDLESRQPSASRALGNKLPSQPGRYHHALYTIFRALWYSAALPRVAPLSPPMKHLRLSLAAFAGALCLFVSACATSHKAVDTVFADSPGGVVSLQSVEDSWFKTAHPVFMSPVLLTHVLRGVQVQMLPDDTTQVRAFSEKDAEFLSPLLSTALSKAMKGQLVAFHVLRGTDAESETTGGVLYVQGRLLHLALTHYRASIEKGDAGAKLDRQSRNPRGLVPGQISFVPETAKRTSLNEQPDLLNPPPLATLVIDYGLLASGIETSSSAPEQSQPLYSDSPAVMSQNASPSMQSANGEVMSHEPQAAQTEEMHAVKALVMKQTAELDALKEDMHAMQRRLAELEVEAEKTKKRQSTSPQRKAVP